MIMIVNDKNYNDNYIDSNDNDDDNNHNNNDNDNDNNLFISKH